MTAPQEQGQPIFPVKKNAKIPLTLHGFKDASSNPEQIESWHREFPGCNWGMPTGEVSGIVVIDLDAKHPESFEWWREQQDIHGIVDTREVATPSGGGHLYFQAPKGLELRSTASQIAPGVDTRAKGGYVVIPPSSIDGHPYEVISDAPASPLPDWLLAVWPKVGQRSSREYHSSGQGATDSGGDLLDTPIPQGQRNTGLARIAGFLWNRPDISLPELEEELLAANDRLCSPPLDPDEVLSIARSIARYPKDDSKVSETDFLTWEEMTAGSYRRPEEHYREGSDGPRRRFPHHTDRGAISNLRNHLNPIWLENRLLEGDQKGYDRAIRCGELQARQCKKCGTIQGDGHQSRLCCKQRMCPRCMGSLARKPLWKKKSLLDMESNLAVYITSLGSYDLGKDVSQWGSRARAAVGQAYQWLSRLNKIRHCPEIVKHSFSGFRADLHQGWLTLDLVLLGPNGFGAAPSLREYFQQATEREIDIEIIPCHDSDTAINTFGNLMSAMAIYGDHDECQTLMTAFKGRRLIQNRGRFVGHQEDPEKDVSNTPEEEVLETSSETGPQKAGGGSPSPPPCHCCGGETEVLGRRTGNWKKVKGEFSGEIYWRLFDDPPPEGRR
jgi:Bifunctional DNA primase/polymerase, N-terminal/Primase C terminal 1 (PriCT-1)